MGADAIGRCAQVVGAHGHAAAVPPALARVPPDSARWTRFEGNEKRSELALAVPCS